MGSSARATFTCGATGCDNSVSCNLVNDGWYTQYFVPQEWHVELGVYDATLTVVRCPDHGKWVVKPGEKPSSGHWELDPGDDTVSEGEEEVKFFSAVPQQFSTVERYKSHKIEEWSKTLRGQRGKWAIWPFPISDRVCLNKASDIRNNKLKWFRSGKWEATTLKKDGVRLLYVRYMG